MAKQTCRCMVKVAVRVFELPQKLGIIQQVEHEPRKHVDGYEGILTAEGCRRGVCIKYRVRVHSRDGRSWTAERRRVKTADWGGCIPPDVADALWELSGRYEVGVWYDYQPLSRSCLFDCTYKVICSITINGVKLPMPYCRSAEDCAEQILEKYKREVEKLKEPPPVSSCNPAEELLKRWPELEAFGVEWVRKWAPHARERLAEIAEVMRRHPWMAEVAKKNAVSPNPHAVEAYAAADGSEVCLLLVSKAYCARNGTIKAVPFEVSCYHAEKKRVCRPKGLLAFAAASEYIKIL